MLNNKKYRLVYVIITATITLSQSVSVMAANDDFFSNNSIYFYESGSSDSSCSSSSVNINTTNRDELPPEATKMADSINIDDKFTKNQERYQYASEKTKVPTQALAAIHYREATMNPSKSMADGSDLDAGVSKDGIKIENDPNEDAYKMAKHFLGMAKSVYGLDGSKIDEWSIDDWGNALLSYNRGSMYKSVNETYKKSPYVMNYIDKDHINMKWVRADSYNGNTKLNSVEGKVNQQLGALTVMLYLGFNFTNGGANGTTVGCADNPTGSNATITETALKLSWDDQKHSQTDPKPEYEAAQKEVGLYGSGCGTEGAKGGPPIVGQDCGVFIATVMRSSGADKDFPTGTSIIKGYLAKHTEKYEKIENNGNTSNLQPGDIFIVNGHIMMYVGTQPNGFNNASASCGDRTADHGGKIYFVDTLGRGTYEIYRKI